MRRYEREIKQLKLKIAQGGGSISDAQVLGPAERARKVGDLLVLAERVSDLDASGMRELADAEPGGHHGRGQLLRVGHAAIIRRHGSIIVCRSNRTEPGPAGDV